MTLPKWRYSGDVTINVKQSDNILCKNTFASIGKKFRIYLFKKNTEEWRIGTLWRDVSEKKKRSPHLDLAPWLPPAASLDRTWVGQSQPNLEHSHSSKLMSQEKWNNLIFDRLTIITLLFRGADNHYQLSGISLFLYFSLKFVNWISPSWLVQGKPLSPS